MPQPPRKDTGESRKVDASLREVVDAIVGEYTCKIFELSRLTSELPHRLFVSDLNRGVELTQVDSICLSMPIGDAKSSVATCRKGGTESDKLQHDADRNAINRENNLAKAISANADAKEDDGKREELADDHGNTISHRPQLDDHENGSTPKPRRKSNFKSRMKDAVSRLSKSSGEESEIYQVLTMICPCMSKCLRMLIEKLALPSPSSVMRRSVSEARLADHIMMHLGKGFKSGTFDLLVGALIIANSASMMMQLEYVGYQSEISLGGREDDGSWDGAPVYFHISEHAFNACFILELLVRFHFGGLRIFRQKSILLDIVLVSCSSIQIYVLQPLDIAEGVNMSLFRMLRFVKFVKIFRIMRVLSLFSDLRILVKTIMSSFGALIWSMVLLVIIMIMSGMFLTGMLEDYIKDPSHDMVQRKWVFKYYGTATRAMYTLFEVTLAGCWPNYFRPLIDHVSTWYICFAVVYISLVVFAIIRIITAIFLKQTLLIASNDAEMMLQEKMKQKKIYLNKLATVFKAVDTSGDGTLSREEFHHILEDQTVKMWLQNLELEVHDSHALFRLLDDGDGEITYEEFLKGVMRLKGQARSMDIVAIMHSTDKTLHEVRCLRDPNMSHHTTGSFPLSHSASNCY